MLEIGTEEGGPCTCTSCTAGRRRRRPSRPPHHSLLKHAVPQRYKDRREKTALYHPSNASYSIRCCSQGMAVNSEHARAGKRARAQPPRTRSCALFTTEDASGAKCRPPTACVPPPAQSAAAPLLSSLLATAQEKALVAGMQARSMRRRRGARGSAPAGQAAPRPRLHSTPAALRRLGLLLRLLLRLLLLLRHGAAEAAGGGARGLGTRCARRALSSTEASLGTSHTSPGASARAGHVSRAPLQGGRPLLAA